MTQSTTSVSLLVVKSLLGSRVPVKCCVCSKPVSSPGSSASVNIASTWIVVSLDKKMHEEKNNNVFTMLKNLNLPARHHDTSELQKYLGYVNNYPKSFGRE